MERSLNNRVRALVKRDKLIFFLANSVKEKKFWWDRLKALFILQRVLKAYLRSHKVPKLQLGAGSYCLRGWFNTDLRPSCNGCFYLDARRPFPFDDNTFQYIFIEHMIEHITYKEAQSMLRECFRVLRPGGRIRVSTPDLEALIGLFTQNKSDLQLRYIKWVIDCFLPKMGSYRESFVINYAFQHWGHKFIYDRSTLNNLLEVIGFIDISWHNIGESNDKNLVSLESHGTGGPAEDMVRFETMVVEAVRP